MAFGFYGLTYSQSDTSGVVDTTGMEPTLSCYMIDEVTFLCSMDEPQGTEGEQTLPGEENEGVIEGEEDINIEGREEDVTREPGTREEEFPAEPERESDEGILPGEESNENDQTESDPAQKKNEDVY